MNVRRAWALTTGLLVLSGLGCGGAGPGDEQPAPPPAPATEKILADDAAAALPPPEFTTGRCRIYTSEPGWSVFIDGSPVRASNGSILQTPCLVEAAAGAHSIAVARDGRLDQAKQVLFKDDAEVVFDAPAAADGESQLLSAPYLDLEVGKAVPLSELNTAGREFDPFLSPDGRGLYFAADRSGAKGIYTATRISPLHPFAAPELLRLTSSIDQAASPSINGEATMVVYTLPAKGRLRALTRSNPLAEFEESRVLLADADADARYPSAQVTASGDRIYFTRETQGITETRVAYPTPDDQQPFGNVRIVQFPGEHPRLSADGLRQYQFDGKTLYRARRTAANLPFSRSEKVIELDLPRYVFSAAHRQFCISDDEQWMIYSDDPAGSGDLWLVRLSNGPGWGVPLGGRTIEPRQIAKAPEMKPEDQPFEPPPVVKPAPEPEPPPDPRGQPLPYVAFQKELAAAASRRDFDAAIDLIEAAQGNADLQSAAELIEWDRQDVQKLIQFWNDVEEGLSLLKPGDRIRFGSLSVEFEKYEGGVITAAARTKKVEKPLAEMDAASIVSLAEPALDREDPAEMLRPAVFLTYAGDGTSSRRKQFLDAAGPLGTEFLDRRAEREARIARMELDRENIVAALARIDQLEKEFPKTAAGRGAAAMREALYARTEWERAGGRNWRTGPNGEFTAGDERVDGAILKSPYEVTDFSLTMEYRTNSPTGQGGVYFTYPGRGRLDNNALKVQLSNDPGVAPDPYCTGALFGLEAPEVNAAGRQGEWNVFQMSVRGSRVSVTINGKKVLDKAFSAGERSTTGYVALDGVSGGISYRKVILSDRPAVK